MAIACQVIRDKVGNIVNVEAANGETSILYKNLKQRFGDQALDLWSYSYTPEFNTIFNDKPRDINGEHILKTVVSSIYPEQLNNKVLPSDILDMLKFNVGSIKELDRKLSSLFENGIININKRTLENTKLFDVDEVTYIIKNKAARNNLNNLVIKVRTLELEDTDQIEALMVNPPTGFFNGQFSSFGKKIYEDIDIQDYVGLTDEELTSKVLQSSNPSFTDKFLNDAVYQRNFKAQVRNLMKVPVYEDITEIPVFKNDTAKTLRNTVVTGVNNKVLLSVISTLRELSPVVWNNNQKEVKKLLKVVKNEALKIAVDLKHFGKSQEETISLLNALEGLSDSLRFNITNLGNIESFAAEYDSYYDVVKEPKSQVVLKSSNTLSWFQNPGTETEMYDIGYIKVDNNLYHKINKNQDIESIFYNQVFTKDILPQDAFKTKSHEDSVVNRLFVKNYVDTKIKDIYGAPNKELREITMYKILYRYPLQSSPKVLPPIEGSNVSYLTGEFLHDFRIAQIKNPVFNVFEIGNQINYLGGNEAELKALENTEVVKHLKEYSRLSKDPVFNSLFPDYVLDDNTRRNLYVNNPALLSSYEGEYNIAEDVLLTNSQEPFIKVNNIVFEKVGQVAMLSKYSPLNIKDTDYNLPANKPSKEVTITAKEFLSLKDRIEATTILNKANVNIEC